METVPVVLPPRPRIPLTKPIWTYVLIGVTVLIYLLQITLGDAFTIAYGLKIDSLIRLGQVWRLVTPMFFHDPSSVLHVLVNMYSLYNVGPEVERTFGGPRFLLLYFVTGFVGFLASFTFSPVNSLGASGAIFGLVGGFAVLLYRNRALLGRVGRNVLYNVVFIILLNIGISFSGGIDMWGHFGGLAGGLLLGWLIGPVWAVARDAFGVPVSIEDHQPLSRQWPLLAVFLLGLASLTILLLILPPVV
jgi:rhomboid protease GluP